MRWAARAPAGRPAGDMSGIAWESRPGGFGRVPCSFLQILASSGLGLEVVYSKQGEQADAVVKRLAEKYGSDCAVVSSDREITNFARVHGCTVITSGDFETRLQVSGARPFARKLEAEEEPVRRDLKK